MSIVDLSTRGGPCGPLSFLGTASIERNRALSPDRVCLRFGYFGCSFLLGEYRRVGVSAPECNLMGACRSGHPPKCIGAGNANKIARSMCLRLLSPF